jgi:PAS domain S-box-containing protein
MSVRVPGALGAYAKGEAEAFRFAWVATRSLSVRAVRDVLLTRGGNMLSGSTASSSDDALAVSFFTNVFRDSAVASIIIAPDSTVLFWNGAAQRPFGWSSEEVPGRTLPSVPADRLDEHRRIRQRTLEGEGFSQHRITRLANDGTPIEVSLSTWPIRGADGRVIALIGIFADIGAEELCFRQSLANKQLEELARIYATAPIGLGFVDTGCVLSGSMSGWQRSTA